MNNKIIQKLYKLCDKAAKNKDIPVSCIIIKNEKIVSSAYNRRVKDNDPLAHAEILAIKKAGKKLNTYNLIDCTLITTLYPCKMCREVIKEARIKKVIYLAENNKEINKKIEYLKYDDNNEYSKKLKEFFKQIR